MMQALYRADRIVCWLGRCAVVLALVMVLVFSFAQVLDFADPDSPAAVVQAAEASLGAVDRLVKMPAMA